MEIYEINNIINEINNEISKINEELQETLVINNTVFCNQEVESIKSDIDSLTQNNNQIIDKIKV